MSWTAVFIVGICCWAIVAITKGAGGSRKKDKQAMSDLQQEHEKLRGELDLMKERLVILEKIVTDEKYDLNKEFANLKD